MGAEEPLTFEQHVRPILKAHCFQCHGEEEEHEGNLDLRLVRLMAKGGDSGPAIVAGKAAKACLSQRMAAGEMPPEGKGSCFGAADRDDPRLDRSRREDRAAGAGGAGRRSPTTRKRSGRFSRFAAPPLPQSQSHPRTCSRRSTPFLLAELEKHKLGFSPAADRRTLIRRVYFDLLGLPPTPEEVDAFLADDSPDAYERLIDRLLALPAYGERWGRHWLDVAGYADSDGYTEKDPERSTPVKYRDYVIRALNADKPWDEFIVEQLAGDELLTPPYANLTPEQADLLAATGFLRMAPDGTGDGGVDQNAGPQRGDGRDDQDRQLVAAGPDGRLRPVPQPSLRPDPAGRLLPPAGHLRAGLRLRRTGGSRRRGWCRCGRDEDASRPPRSTPS